MDIEKDLKVLEIIKKKEVNIGALVYLLKYSENPLAFYNEDIDNLELTQDEFDLIKEWLERY